MTLQITLPTNESKIVSPLEFKWFRYSRLKRFLRGVEQVQEIENKIIACTKSNIINGDWEIHVFDKNGQRLVFNRVPFIRLKVY